MVGRELNQEDRTSSKPGARAKTLGGRMVCISLVCLLIGGAIINIFFPEMAKGNKLGIVRLLILIPIWITGITGLVLLLIGWRQKIAADRCTSKSTVVARSVFIGGLLGAGLLALLFWFLANSEMIYVSPGQNELAVRAEYAVQGGILGLLLGAVGGVSVGLLLKLSHRMLGERDTATDQSSANQDEI